VFLDGSLAIHTLELPKYNLRYEDLASGDALAWWLYWLRHAAEFEADALRSAFPQPAFRRASEALIRIAQKSEDKTMYDRHQKAVRDRNWMLNAAKVDALDAGRIECRTAGEQELSAMSLQQLEALTGSLQEKLRGRGPA